MSGSPHTHGEQTVKKIMWGVVIALMPAMLVSFWYFGLPASSSHTLIGSIIGVGLANSIMGPNHSFIDGVNWAKAQDVGIGLLISPLVGFWLL